MLFIDDEIAVRDYLDYLKLDSPKILQFDKLNKTIETSDYTVKVSDCYFDKVEPEVVKLLSEKYDPLIYGKDSTENIVAIEIVGNNVVLFREVKGKIITETRPHKYWIIANKPARDGSSTRLEGNQFFKHLKEYESKEEWDESRKLARKFNLYCVTNPVEGAMIRHGYTFFKNTKIADISTLSFDIETTGLNKDADDAQVLLITNAFRKNNVITNKSFAIDDFKSERNMLESWVKWVQEVDPSIILGHNLVGYDIPYLMARAEANGIELELGRDLSPVYKEEFTRKFRKDGSQEYSYNRIHIFGRNVLDTFFISIRYDIGRKYSSYRLKTIIKEEGLEKEGRTHLDASKIKSDWKDPEKRKLIKKYGEEDAEDALKLFELMIPAQFYICQYIPKPFQVITESATGAQINSFLVRSYLQDGWSIPLASETTYVQGGISFGVPGVYGSTIKADLKSAYPSQILRFKLYDKQKDPKMHFYLMVKYFTEQRFENKLKGQQTGDRYYKDLDASGKVLINSSYGALSTNGLNFNNSEIAERITEETRKVIEMAVKWASGNTIDKYWSKNEPT